MLKNVGSIDRIIRVVLGLGVIVTGFALQSWWGLIGLALLGTAGISFCPIYMMLGLTTCKIVK